MMTTINLAQRVMKFKEEKKKNNAPGNKQTDRKTRYEQSEGKLMTVV